MEIEASDAKDAEYTFWQEGYGGDIENANFAYADDITDAEYVYHEPSYEAEWLCLCGNTASDYGSVISAPITSSRLSRMGMSL